MLCEYPKKTKTELAEFVVEALKGRKELLKKAYGNCSFGMRQGDAGKQDKDLLKALTIYRDAFNKCEASSELEAQIGNEQPQDENRYTNLISESRKRSSNDHNREVSSSQG